MLPLRIKPFLKNIVKNEDDDILLVEGDVSCCDKQEFELYFNGSIRKSILLGRYLYSDDNKIVLEARCKKCGRKILIFDSSIDGYSHCDNNTIKCDANLKYLKCEKCKKNTYAIKIKYEYTGIQELKEEGSDNIENAYSWIWISLKCNECGFEYKNIIDFETA